jgi:hypothetical protein
MVAYLYTLLFIVCVLYSTHTGAGDEGRWFVHHVAVLDRKAT